MYWTFRGKEQSLYFQVFYSVCCKCSWCNSEDKPKPESLKKIISLRLCHLKLSCNDFLLSRPVLNKSKTTFKNSLIAASYMWIFSGFFPPLWQWTEYLWVVEKTRHIMTTCWALGNIQSNKQLDYLRKLRQINPQWKWSFFAAIIKELTRKVSVRLETRHQLWKIWLPYFVIFAVVHQFNNKKKSF